MWSEADIRDIIQQDGGTALVHAQRDMAQIIQFVHVAGRAHHVLGLCHLDDRTARLLVAPLYGLPDPGQRQAIGTQLVRVEHHLVLLDHAADGGHFRYAVQRLQFILQKPVLQAAQLRQVVPAAAINQGILVHPAHTGGIRTEFRARLDRQLAAHLAQVFKHPRACPVGVRAILENDVHVGITEE